MRMLAKIATVLILLLPSLSLAGKPEPVLFVWILDDITVDPGNTHCYQTMEMISSKPNGAPARWYRGSCFVSPTKRLLLTHWGITVTAALDAAGERCKGLVEVNTTDPSITDYTDDNILTIAGSTIQLGSSNANPAGACLNDTTNMQTRGVSCIRPLAQLSGSISKFEVDGGNTKVTSAGHPLSDESKIFISGANANYNGVHTVVDGSVGDGYFSIDTPYVDDPGQGTWTGGTNLIPGGAYFRPSLRNGDGGAYTCGTMRTIQFFFLGWEM